MFTCDAIATAIGGAEIVDASRLASLADKINGATHFFESPPDIWAVFVVAGKNFAKVELEGVKSTKRVKYKPLVAAQNYDAIRAIAPHYSALRPYILYEIAGKPEIIAPPADLPQIKRGTRNHASRVDTKLLATLSKHSNLNPKLRKRVASLLRRYKKLKTVHGSERDLFEERALLDFATDVLSDMGLRSHRIKATQMIRTLEGAELGADRDHFFHSFQNCSLGLAAIAECRDAFGAYKDLARIHWEIEPADVWFLTTMWHDVGYGAQNFENLVGVTFSDDVRDQAAQVRQTFFNHPARQEALHVLSYLTERLLRPEAGTTEWMEPSTNTTLGPDASRIQTVYKTNFLGGSHGAFGALRLFYDYNDDVDRMEPETRLRLKQTMLLSAASMPFHDWSFRTQLRKEYGDFKVKPCAMPFAALLMFVDSIQDDRRDLGGGEDAVQVLKALRCYEKTLVVAEINQGALRDLDLLEKIVEARDVTASMSQSAGELQFKYPTWLVPTV